MLCVLCWLLALPGIRPVCGDEFLLADGQLWPGEIFTSDGHHSERRIFRLDVNQLPAGRNSVPRIAGIAASGQNHIFFCSGVDGHIHQLDRKAAKARLVYTHPGQVRDLALQPRTDELHFSAIPTPLRGQRLTGGSIYRFDRRSEKAEVTCEVDNAAVANQWQGAFAFLDRQLHLATNGVPSRVLRVDGKELLPVFATREFRIHGIAFAGQRLLLLAGDGRLLEAVDNEQAREVTLFGHNFTNLTVVRRQPATAGGLNRDATVGKP